ncbi:MAG: DUF2970 domain-containing protein [Burkholderiales bacterium]
MMADAAKPGAPVRSATLLQTVKAVLWSFFGIRRNAAHAHDVAQLKLVHVIITGIVLAVSMVVGLVLFARWIVASQGA